MASTKGSDLDVQRRLDDLYAGRTRFPQGPDRTAHLAGLLSSDQRAAVAEGLNLSRPVSESPWEPDGGVR